MENSFEINLFSDCRRRDANDEADEDGLCFSEGVAINEGSGSTDASFVNQGMLGYAFGVDRRAGSVAQYARYSSQYGIILTIFFSRFIVQQKKLI